MSQYINCMQHHIHITPNLGTSQCNCINKMENDEKKCAVLTAIQRDWLCGDLKPYCHGEDKIPPEFYLDYNELNMDSFQVGIDDNNCDTVAQEAKSIYIAMTAVNRVYALAHNEYCGLETTPDVKVIPGWDFIKEIYIKGTNSKRFLFAVLIQKQDTFMLVIRGEQTYLDTYAANSMDLEWVHELESYVNPDKYYIATQLYDATLFVLESFSTVECPNQICDPQMQDKLFIVGHSLGGSVGAILSLLYERHRCRIYTIPKVVSGVVVTEEVVMCRTYTVNYIGYGIVNVGDISFWNTLKDYTFSNTLKTDITARLYAYENDYASSYMCMGCNMVLDGFRW
eukprot:GHVR01102103.1.p1 GENE.GHVR01102103.1~~GHVR01102103.1.p1  ORF type:complete len:340 (+),score=42.91 GHVR01102103.1:3-1022(+)